MQTVDDIVFVLRTGMGDKINMIKTIIFFFLYLHLFFALTVKPVSTF